MNRRELTYRFIGLGLAAFASMTIGAATLNEIAGKPFRSYPEEFKTSLITLSIPSQGHPEYYVRMEAGDTIVYSWDVLNNKEPNVVFTYFHSDGALRPGMLDRTISDQASTGSEGGGSLIAAWKGIYGWSWENKGDSAVTVRLRIAGFYELIPEQPGKISPDNFQNVPCCN